MINANMRLYDYYTLEKKNEYGQQLPSEDVKGTIRMAITHTGTAVQDNINYKNAKYLGLTLAAIDDTYFIQYGEEKLKVLYIVPFGRYKQVYLGEV